MSTILDCQGLDCPQPVIRCKQSIENDSPSTLTVIVDNEPARENVGRFLRSRGYDVTFEPDGSVWKVVGTNQQPGATPDTASNPSLDQAQPVEIGRVTMVLISTQYLGVGSDELGEKLMLNFISTLPEMGDHLWRIVLVNGGVKLAAGNGPIAKKLQEIESSGVSILVCGTCLEYFGLLEAKSVGQTTNMLDVVTSLDNADKVIKI
ncbi:sulfurtransferase-like selenium metabolism protein YedF [Desulfovibrio inopinatus]|uniref:sulfurtransferase-like selenium metabolism protein YedF n=1 Tax=Desulfovibrio inopinatus TaxID=102109 RepID=UPI000416CB7D|nr:sulfurtransferase-like selenium metabolism protein YedF [Desulfovibrio inopinatus]